MKLLFTPYTFIATIQAVLRQEQCLYLWILIRKHSRLILTKLKQRSPRGQRQFCLFISLGLPANMVKIMAIAKKHNLLVVEDACQAWLAEINHKKVGTFGNAGCFSFQNSKHIPIGEGGAIVSDDDEFMDRCYSYHNYGNPYGTVIRCSRRRYSYAGNQTPDDGISGSYRACPVEVYSTNRPPSGMTMQHI